MTTPTGRAVPRRAFLSVAALLAPGFLDRVAAATIAAGPEPAPDPSVPATFVIAGLPVQVHGQGLSATARFVPRPEALGHRPQPEPAGFRLVERRWRHVVPGLIEYEWAANPSDDCTRCRRRCTAARGLDGRWYCRVGTAGVLAEDYEGPARGEDDPGYLGDIAFGR